MPTAIRVRGKNARDLSFKGKSPDGSSSNIDGIPRKPNGRPLKLTTSSASWSAFSPASTPFTSYKPSKTQPSASILEKGRRRSQLSSLEKLPPELLQSIFLYAPNLNLPLASPYVGATLSSEHVFTHLALSAFNGMDENSGLTDLLPIHKYADVDDIPDYGDATLQTAILKCRWFTHKFLLICKRKYLERKVGGGPYTRTSLGGKYYHDLLTRYWWPVCTAGCQIPERLLHSPWPDAKVNLLRLLVHSGAQVDWVNSSLGEVADNSLREAISDTNALPVYCLLHPMIGTKVSTELLRFAVMECGYDHFIVSILVIQSIQNRHRNIDWDDWELLDWARTRGDQEGTWLEKCFMVGRNLSARPDIGFRYGSRRAARLRHYLLATETDIQGYRDLEKKFFDQSQFQVPTYS
ncbi:MAG: hypothetical protein M1827_001104 [Pycnora praestabilis]|nr:MAG: hypothetical protein M1827_001104 [Pycnora praestabilis]